MNLELLRRAHAEIERLEMDADFYDVSGDLELAQQSTHTLAVIRDLLEALPAHNTSEISL